MLRRLALLLALAAAAPGAAAFERSGVGGCDAPGGFVESVEGTGCPTWRFLRMGPAGTTRVVLVPNVHYPMPANADGELGFAPGERVQVEVMPAWEGQDRAFPMGGTNSFPGSSEGTRNWGGSWGTLQHLAAQGWVSITRLPAEDPGDGGDAVEPACEPSWTAWAPAASGTCSGSTVEQTRSDGCGGSESREAQGTRDCCTQRTLGEWGACDAPADFDCEARDLCGEQLVTGTQSRDCSAGTCPGQTCTTQVGDPARRQNCTAVVDCGECPPECDPDEWDVWRPHNWLACNTREVEQTRTNFTCDVVEERTVMGEWDCSGTPPQWSDWSCNASCGSRTCGTATGVQVRTCTPGTGGHADDPCNGSATGDACSVDCGGDCPTLPACSCGWDAFTCTHGYAGNRNYGYGPRDYTWDCIPGSCTGRASCFNASVIIPPVNPPADDPDPPADPPGNRCSPPTSWSPSPSTVCSGETFTQSGYDGCMDRQTRTATGTKNCGGGGTPPQDPPGDPDPPEDPPDKPDPPTVKPKTGSPPSWGGWSCNASCGTRTCGSAPGRNVRSCTPGTDEYAGQACSGSATGSACSVSCGPQCPPACTPSWTPSPSTVCLGRGFRQSDGCGNSRDATGTKTTGSCTPQCTPSWTPSPSTVCSGEGFRQSDGCGNSRDATGTKSCPTNACTSCSCVDLYGSPRQPSVTLPDCTWSCSGTLIKVGRPHGCIPY